MTEAIRRFLSGLFGDKLLPRIHENTAFFEKNTAFSRLCGKISNQKMADFWHIILNPVSGGGAARRLWPRIERALQKMEFGYSVKFTERAGHAAEIAESIILKGGQRILVIGGDGTAHEAANGILRQDFEPSESIALAVFPVGTGNDFAREFGWASAPDAFFQMLKKGETRLIDAGRVVFQDEKGAEKERFFIKVSGMAYDAFVAREAAKQVQKGSFLGYYRLILQCLWKYRLTPASLFFDENGSEKRADDSFYTINVGICRFSGGGMRFVPQAVPDDGLFALTFARKMSKLRVVLATPFFYNGKVAQHPKVTATQTRSLRVEHADGQPPVLLEADGEFLGQSPCAFFLLEKALRVVV